MARRAVSTALRIRWIPFQLDKLPNQSGIYRITSGKRWLYVGRAKDISARLSQASHPAQITKDLTLEMDYAFTPLKEGLGSLEYKLIDRYEPEWNGETSFYQQSRFPCCELLLASDAEILSVIEG